MKRREFGKSLFALGMAPALPVNAHIAASAPVVEASVSQYMYGLANFYTRLHGEASIAKLQSYLPLSNAQASQVMTRLVSEGVISAPNAAGVANAAKPFAKRSRNLSKQVIEDGFERAKSMAQEVIGETETPNVSTNGETILNDLNDEQPKNGSSDIIEERH